MSALFKGAWENGLSEWHLITVATSKLAIDFAAGFSTAVEVTDVSGRGVGMDVVRRNIEALGGRIDIESVEAKVQPLKPIATYARHCRWYDSFCGKSDLYFGL